MFDLNSFVPANSDLHLFETDFINHRGDIAGLAFLTSGEVNQYLLLRCGERDRAVASRTSMKGGLYGVRLQQPKDSRKAPSRELIATIFSHIRRGLRNVEPR